MNALTLAQELVAFNSVSHRSNVDVSDCVARTLQTLGFETERVAYADAAGVPKLNILGRRGPATTGGLAYFCHTDVVPADDWHSDTHGPFDPQVANGRLYGRGACDMKGSLATMLAAAARVPNTARPLYIVCTADEETGFHGAKQVAARSQIYAALRVGGAAGIIGEPTTLQVVHAHKGSVGLRFTSRGEAAHSSSAAGCNANLAMIPLLAEMKRLHDLTETDPAWQDARFDPPTLSWNIGINDHTAAINVKAARSVCTVYLRPMPGQNPAPLIEQARTAAAQHGIAYEVFFEAAPFFTQADAPVVRELLALTNANAARTVCYGTDAAVFGALGRIAVCGPGDIAQAHTRDEWIALEQLEHGTDFYELAIRHFCGA